MKLETNGDYNPIQLNETINLSPDGKVLSKSLMFNLRGETPKEVWKAYQKLKKLIDGEEAKPKKSAKKETQEGNKQNENLQKKDENICPECGGMLVEKSGISNKNGRPYHFWGCSNWPICNFTKPFLTEEEKKKLEAMPCDQDLIEEEVPF